MAVGKLVEVTAVAPHQLRLLWDDGVERTCDLTSIIGAHPLLGPLQAHAVFNKVGLSDDGWSVEWPSGIDFGSPQLRRWTDEQNASLVV